jgi:hypothetical protein
MIKSTNARIEGVIEEIGVIISIEDVMGYC